MFRWDSNNVYNNLTNHQMAFFQNARQTCKIWNMLFYTLYNKIPQIQIVGIEVGKHCFNSKRECYLIEQNTKALQWEWEMQKNTPSNLHKQKLSKNIGGNYASGCQVKCELLERRYPYCTVYLE